MAQATFRHGVPLMVDYTPSGADVAAGDVVLIGNTAGWTCGVAHLDIEDGVLGALAAGGGVYEVVNLNNAANGTKVYWDNTNDKVTTTSTNNAQFGFIVSRGGGGANTNCLALHKPYV
jgi:predicted RecA/RadA family phage recombinase